MPGNDTIFNASLLGSALLARCYSYTGDKDAFDLATQSVEACCSAQKADGSWTYGVKPVTAWIDSFHTGYNLMALAEYQRFTDDRRYGECVERGMKYYVDKFFMADGAPKYYHDNQYPIDIHCVGQLFVTLSVLNVESQYNKLITSVFDWSMRNMWDPRGYFYYQLKQGVSSKISYMRWSNAFMFSALATILEKTIGEPSDN